MTQKGAIQLMKMVANMQSVIVTDNFPNGTEKEALSYAIAGTRLARDILIRNKDALIGLEKQLNAFNNMNNSFMTMAKTAMNELNKQKN